MMTAPDWLTSEVRTVAGFPRDGINFYDLAAVWQSSSAMSRCAIALAGGRDDIDAVMGIEARGFIFAVPVAQRLGVGFVAARKPGKIPPPFHGVNYDLEYGSDSLEVSADAMNAGDRVLIVDDVIATGGTVNAGIELVRASGAEVAGVAIVIELDGLGGRSVVEAQGVDLTALWKAPQ